MYVLEDEAGEQNYYFNTANKGCPLNQIIEEFLSLKTGLETKELTP